MRRNKIIERMRNGEKAVGLNLSFYADEIIEMAGLMGLDFVRYDGQHSPITPETIDRMCRMCDGFGVTPTMRVPDQIPSNILNYLDRGVMAITVPDLETKEQAEALVRACYFAPKGRRSFTSQRVVQYGFGGDLKTVMEDTNANTLVFPQLESITAYENLDEILTVEGIDIFSGGPSDLAQSMGHPGENDHPDCLRVVEEGSKKIRAAGKRELGDLAVSVDATGSVQAAIGALLKENAR